MSHYGHDDFGDQGQLIRTLNRERSKDMASDYARVDPAQAFAEPRGISFGEPVAEIVRKIPERARGIFAGFRPSQQALETATIVKEQVRTPNQRHAVERYARAVDEIARMRTKGLPVLPHQRAAFDRACDALNAIRPEAASDLSAAFEQHPELVHEAAQGRSTATLRAMQLEVEIRTDPFQRANRFVESWQQLRRRHGELVRDGNMQGAQKVAQSMSGMTKSLERDPQLESLLRGRSREFGLELEATRKLSQSLAASVPFYPTRDRGLSL